MPILTPQTLLKKHWPFKTTPLPPPHPTIEISNDPLWDSFGHSLCILNFKHPFSSNDFTRLSLSLLLILSVAIMERLFILRHGVEFATCSHKEMLIFILICGSLTLAKCFSLSL